MQEVLSVEKLLYADHVQEEDSSSVGVLTRTKAKAMESPRKDQWATLPKPTAEVKRDACETHASHAREAGSFSGGAANSSTVKESSNSSIKSPYGKIPDALSSFLLHLQSRDAFCRQRTWRASPRNEVESGLFRGRWSVDQMGLTRRDGKIYIPKDLATRKAILRANHDNP